MSCDVKSVHASAHYRELIVSKTYSKHIDMTIGFESKCRIDFLPASISLLRLNCFNVHTFKCAPITSHEL